MDSIELIGIATSLSLLAGWRLYAVVLAVGLGVRFGGFEFIGLPGSFGAMHVLGTPAVLIAAGVAAAAEFLADKVPIVDSIWDLVHALVRPVGAALLALAVVSPDDPAMTIVTLLLGGGGGLLAHVAKAGTRAVVNTSPEPFSNLAVSVGEDVVTAGALWLLITHPAWAAALAILLLAIVVALLWLAVRLLGSLLRALRRRRRA
jgi:Domain of unknown function (DUF4126)